MKKSASNTLTFIISCAFFIVLGVIVVSKLVTGFRPKSTMYMVAPPVYGESQSLATSSKDVDSLKVETFEQLSAVMDNVIVLTHEDPDKPENGAYQLISLGDALTSGKNWYFDDELGSQVKSVIGYGYYHTYSTSYNYEFITPYEYNQLDPDAKSREIQWKFAPKVPASIN